MGERKEIEGAGPVWESLERRFRAPLRAYFGRRVPSPDDADDLTQEVFTRLLRNPDLAAGETPEIHVFKIASATLQDWNRYRASRGPVAAAALAGVAETLGTPPLSLEDRARKDALRELEEGLRGLAGRTREIFLLSRVENVATHEIARLYDLSEAAVKQHVLTAMVHLSARSFAP